MIKVSVIMPAYNSEKTIRESIESVLCQQFDNFELIIVDDGSTDSTYNICNSIIDSRLHVVTQKNQGPSSARNRGLELAKGKYIMFIDSDDFFVENTLNDMYNCIEKEKSDIVAGFYRSFSNRNNVYGIKNKNAQYFPNKKMINKKEDYIGYLQNRSLLNSNWNKIYKKEIISKNNPKFDVKIEIGEDVKFNFDYLKYANSFSICPTIMYLYYLNENGLTKKNEIDRLERMINFLKYQENYYKELNMNTSMFQIKVFKDFFHIYNKDEKINNEFDSFIFKIKNKILRIKILNWLCQKKKRRIINIIIKIYVICRNK